MEAILPDFDYLESDPKQHSILKEVTEEVGVTADDKLENRTERDKKLTFYIPASKEHFTALHETKLKLKLKVTKKDGVACNHAAQSAPDKVAVVNNVFHTIWSKVCVYLNGHLVEMLDNYAYKAYLSTLLSYDKDVTNVRGELIGWAKDLHGEMDIATSDGANTGAVTRAAQFSNSKTVTLVGRLLSDVFLQGRSIPPNTEVKVELYPARDKFVLMAPTGSEYEMHIKDAKFLVHRQIVAPSLLHAYQQIYSKRNMKLKYRQVAVKEFNIQVSGSREEKVVLVKELTTLPDRFLVGIVTNKAYGGQYQSNPFNFKHFDIESIVATVGTENYPNIPYKPDFASTTGNDYILLYERLLREFNADEENRLINITPTEFKNGFTLIPFRLVPRACGGDILGEPIFGDLKLSITFANAPTETLTVIVLAERRVEHEIGQQGDFSFALKTQHL